ncbi:hypothetical protein LTR37_009916 [Vermiconidia calcicola]|uniref:Uncharacterized protein n=1 Tax=Vermiconidia calcicola TaxID=1690605 RepID=A0ACC3N6N6_9PEZI|nr:hypothetical protein LTR37_009916 [Vermiconidia calcicola]
MSFFANKMAPSIVHHATELLSQAGGTTTSQVFLAGSNKAVLRIGRDFDQEEIDAIANYLHTTHRDTWLQVNRHGHRVPGPADDCVGMPSVSASAGLRSSHPRKYGQQPGQDSQDDSRPELAYALIIIRGRTGASYGKVRILYSYAAVAAAVFEEVANGYSIAFSAALLKMEVAQLTGSRKSFAKVEDVHALYASAGSTDPNKRIALLC